MFIIRPDLNEEGINSTIEEVTRYMESNGCQIKRVERWGMRKLAYEVKKYREGYYVIIIFDAEPQFTEPFKRWLLMRDGVIRMLLVRSEADPTKPIKVPSEVLDVYEEEMTAPPSAQEAGSKGGSEQSEKEG